MEKALELAPENKPDESELSILIQRNLRRMNVLAFLIFLLEVVAQYRWKLHPVIVFVWIFLKVYGLRKVSILLSRNIPVLLIKRGGDPWTQAAQACFDRGSRYIFVLSIVLSFALAGVQDVLFQTWSTVVLDVGLVILFAYLTKRESQILRRLDAFIAENGWKSLGDFPPDQLN